MKRNSNFLRTEYLKVLIPVMCSVLGGTINALIDSVIISLKLGKSGLAAVNLSMPVYLLLCIIGALVAYGASFRSAKEAGAERMKLARRFFHSAFTLGMVTGIVCMITGFFVSAPIAEFLSNGSGLQSYVFDYIQMTFLGSIPFILSYTVINYLQLEGKLKNITIIVIVMVLSDLALDILFIYPLDMGMKGLALASVISMLAATVYGFIALGSGITNYRLNIKELTFFGTKQILRDGSPSALGNLFDAVKLLLINLLVLNFAGEDAAAVWAALNILSEVSLIIVSGVPRAGSQMLSVYNASRENSGLRILLKLEMKTGIILSVIYTVLLVALSGFLKNIFSLPESILLPLICLGVSIIFSVISSNLEFFFNAVDKIILSNIMGALRRLIFPVCVLWILASANIYLWLFLPIGALAALLSSFLIVLIRSGTLKKKGIDASPVLLLDDSLEKEHKVLDFSIPADMTEVCNASEKIADFCAIHDLSPKQVMRLGLSIEELLNVIIQKSPDIRFVDLRAYVLTGVFGIRIRCTGMCYNPFDDQDSDEDFLMGITMLEKMCQVVKHTYALGMNTINIIFDNEG